MSTNLSGKGALITEGSRGIGAAIARRFAQDGASVTFTYNSSEEKAHALADGIKTNGGTSVAIKANNSVQKLSSLQWRKQSTGLDASTSW